MSKPASSPPLLSVRELKKTYTILGQGGFWSKPVSLCAVDSVSFELRAGETLGVVGESGCGKTTLAKCIARLEEPTGGFIDYRGRELQALGGEELRLMRRHIQYIFQDPFESLNSRMTVEQIIGEIWRVFPEILPRTDWRRRARDLLEQVGLSADDLDRYPHQFSGGQRQRIGIARALASEPDLLICDEPVSALDVSIQAQVINLFQDIQERRGVALLFIAHDLSVVRHIADRTMVMYLGRVVEEGPSEVLFEAPAHAYTQALVSAVPVVDPKARVRRRDVDLAGEPPSPIDQPPGCAFHEHCPRAVPCCAEERPLLGELEDGRRVACHVPEPIDMLGLS